MPVVYRYHYSLHDNRNSVDDDENDVYTNHNMIYLELKHIIIKCLCYMNENDDFVITAQYVIPYNTIMSNRVNESFVKYKTYITSLLRDRRNAVNSDFRVCAVKKQFLYPSNILLE